MCPTGCVSDARFQFRNHSVFASGEESQGPSSPYQELVSLGAPGEAEFTHACGKQLYSRYYPGLINKCLVGNLYCQGDNVTAHHGPDATVSGSPMLGGTQQYWHIVTCQRGRVSIKLPDLRAMRHGQLTLTS